MEKILLPVRRFQQKGPECGIAAAASIANYYNPDINYKELRKTIPYVVRQQGICTGQQVQLFNSIGFKKVTIISSYLEVVDYSWRKLSKTKLIKRLQKLEAYKLEYNGKEDDWYVYTKFLRECLADPNMDNNLIVDFDFHAHIKKYLQNGHPLSADMNITALFHLPKSPKRPGSDITGNYESHNVVIHGYDESYVYLIDPDHWFTKEYRVKKGHCRIRWEQFLCTGTQGDLVVLQ